MKNKQRDKDHEFPWIEFDAEKVYCTVCKSFRRMANWGPFVNKHRHCGKTVEKPEHNYLAGLGPFI